jgi:hypothetical protein
MDWNTLTGDQQAILTSAQYTALVASAPSMASNPSQNAYPTVLLNGSDPGAIAQIDPMTFKYRCIQRLKLPVTVELLSPYDNSKIFYETNGSNPYTYSKLYNGPLVFTRNASGSDRTVIKARIYDAINPSKHGKIIRIQFQVYGGS